MPEIEVVQGDITTARVDAIVNAANNDLTNGSGVNGAIHQAAGPELPIALRAFTGCMTGDAVLTPGFQLACKFVIHTVGPIWHGGSLGEEALLRRCYQSSLELARQNNAESIAFPAISTGIYGYPLTLAVPIAVSSVKKHADIALVKFYAFDSRTFELYRKELAA